MPFKITSNFNGILVSLLLCLAVIVTGCNNSTSTPSPDSTTPSPAITLSITTVKSTDTATPTEVESVAPKALLVKPEAGSTIDIASLENTIADLAADSGLDFEVISGISERELTPDVKVVVVVAPDPGLIDLALSAPATQFVGIDIPGLEPADNLSVIGSQQLGAAEIGFMAGYLAALITEEYRVGVISSASQDGVAYRQGFINGVVFFCGLCRQTYPPFNRYPLYAEVPEGAGISERRAAADTLISLAVKTAYVAPGIDELELLEYLTQADVNLVGTGTPPASLQSSWAASIQSAPERLLVAIWDDLLNGKGGAYFPSSVILTNVNPELLSPGRQRLVEEVLAELAAGYIDIGVEP